MTADGGLSDLVADMRELQAGWKLDGRSVIRQVAVVVETPDGQLLRLLVTGEGSPLLSIEDDAGNLVSLPSELAQ